MARHSAAAAPAGVRGRVLFPPQAYNFKTPPCRVGDCMRVRRLRTATGGGGSRSPRRRNGRLGLPAASVSNCSRDPAICSQTCSRGRRGSIAIAVALSRNGTTCGTSPRLSELAMTPSDTTRDSAATTRNSCSATTRPGTCGGSACHTNLSPDKTGIRRDT